VPVLVPVLARALALMWVQEQMQMPQAQPRACRTAPR
jgi:hypothetical protein